LTFASPGTHTVTAYYAGDANYAATSKTLDVAVTANADVAVSLKSSIDAVTGLVRYVIHVTNAGPSPVIGVHVVDVLDSGLASPSWTCVTSGGSSCAASGTGALDLPVDLPVGSGVLIEVTATLVDLQQATLAYAVSAIMPGSTVDATPANNQASIDEPVRLFADGFEDLGNQAPTAPGAAIKLPVTSSVIALPAGELAGMPAGAEAAEVVRIERGAVQARLEVRNTGAATEIRLLQRAPGGDWTSNGWKAVTATGKAEIRWAPDADGATGILVVE